MSNQIATERILQVASSAKSEAKRAESEFDSRNAAIQRKASRSIDLFGGSATSQVADIARDARRACDDLYSAYQSLVRIVDEQCRPLLDQDPSVTAVKEVCDLIKWLNDESEIESNFTASLNSRSLGDVASARYVPTMDNKMIQRYWENKYAMWPGRAEEEAKARQEAEERRKAQAQAAREAQEKARQELAAKMEVYEREHKEWQKKKAAAEQARGKALQEALDAERARLSNETQSRYTSTRDKLKAERDDAVARKAAAEAKLPTLGFFAFSEKSATKKTIENLNARIASLDAQLSANETWYQNERRSNDSKLRDLRKKLEDRIKREHPIPEEPRKPSAAPAAPMSAQQVANYSVMQEMLDFMEPGELYTVTDFIYKCPVCADLTNQRVSALLRGVIGINVERIENYGKVYFRLINRELRRMDRPVSALAAAPASRKSYLGPIPDAILNFMEPGKLYTITDFITGCPACADLTNQRCSAYVRQLVSSGDIERIEERMKAYFRLPNK